MFKKILIANRGEIALRINRACHEMGIQTVAVHSTVDSDAMHVRLADESVCIGPPPSKDSYLNIPSILSAATISGADAIHPGIGFLAENVEFATIVNDHGFTFIGPSAKHIKLMGNKLKAKETMQKLGVPVIPGSNEPITDDESAFHLANKIGFPILIKATEGGGGKGMKVAHSPKEFLEALNIARTETNANFASDSIFLEKFLTNPQHIEIQILADSHQNTIHLGERDCSIQRRHQKLWEEAPSPSVNAKKINSLGEIVCNAVKEIGYTGLGTFEFLYEDGNFYFIEMNTRLQLEHTITEMITGIDLVCEQIQIAQGAKISFSQKDINLSGHAIECRINAEHPKTFHPSPGQIKDYHAPGGLNVRVDSALYSGYRVPPNYDSLVAKLIVKGATRKECLLRLKRALYEYVIDGIQTTIPLHKKLVNNKDIISGEYNIHWLEEQLKAEKL